jgi:hypothetical protein
MIKTINKLEIIEEDFIIKSYLDLKIFVTSILEDLKQIFETPYIYNGNPLYPIYLCLMSTLDLIVYLICILFELFLDCLLRVWFENPRTILNIYFYTNLISILVFISRKTRIKTKHIVDIALSRVLSIYILNEI